MRKVFHLFILSVLLLLFASCGKGSITFTDLTPPSSEAQASFSPTETPLPSAEPYVFAADLSLLPTDQAEHLAANDAADAWESLTDAILNVRTSVELNREEALRPVMDVFERSPFADIATLESDGTRIRITYSAACSAEALKDAVESLLNGSLSAEHDHLETLLSLYQTAAQFQYADTSSPSLYRTLAERKGSSEEISMALQYLLTQAGFKARLAYASSADHYWVIAEVDGSTYHFDPVFEAAATNGLGLSYFGMSDATHAASIGSSDYTVGLGASAEQHNDLCSSTTLDELFSDVTAWELDLSAHTIAVQFGFETDGTTEYSTKAFGN